MKTFDVFRRLDDGSKVFIGEVSGDDADDALDTAKILAESDHVTRLSVRKSLLAPDYKRHAQ